MSLQFRSDCSTLCPVALAATAHFSPDKSTQVSLVRHTNPDKSTPSQFGSATNLIVSDKSSLIASDQRTPTTHIAPSQLVSFQTYIFTDYAIPSLPESGHSSPDCTIRFDSLRFLSPPTTQVDTRLVPYRPLKSTRVVSLTDNPGPTTPSLSRPH
jgi:hypothetical protein